GQQRHSSEASFWLLPTLAGVKRKIGESAAAIPRRRRQSRPMVNGRLAESLQCDGSGAAYSSLPRVTTIEASILVRVHSMLSRRKRMETLSPRSKPMRLMQREEPVATSGLGMVKMRAPAEAISSKNCGLGLRSVLE